MGKKEAAPKDMFMQFASLVPTLDAANTSTTVELELPTGMSVRGGLIWLIHQVEVDYSALDHIIRSTTADLFGMLMVALSTKKALGNVPNIAADGTIIRDSVSYVASFEAADTTHHVLVRDHVKRYHFLPPIPIASPRLTAYIKTAAAEVELQGLTVPIRVGFTTAPLDSKTYTEIIETWGW